MKNKSCNCFIIALLGISLLFTGCYSYLASKNEEMLWRGPHAQPIDNLKCEDDTLKNTYFERLICHGRNNLRQDEKFEPELAKDNELRVVGFNDNRRKEHWKLRSCFALSGSRMCTCVSAS